MLLLCDVMRLESVTDSSALLVMEKTNVPDTARGKSRRATVLLEARGALKAPGRFPSEEHSNTVYEKYQQCQNKAQVTEEENQGLESPHSH